MKNDKSIALPVINTERRRFFTQAASGLGIVICGGMLSSLGSCEPFTSKVPTAPTGSKAIFDTVKDDPDKLLQSVGNGLLIKLKDTNGNSLNGSNSILIIREAPETEMNFLVLSARCTHEGQDVAPPGGPGENIICPLHLSQFSSLDGSRIEGLAPTSLTKFNSTYDPATKLLTIFA